MKLLESVSCATGWQTASRTGSYAVIPIPSTSGQLYGEQRMPMCDEHLTFVDIEQNARWRESDEAENESQSKVFFHRFIAVISSKQGTRTIPRQ